MHPQTLRIYEARGLITPKRSPKNTRLYSQDDVERLRRIQELTSELGMNLAGVERVFELEEEMERMRRRMRNLERQAERSAAGAQRGDRARAPLVQARAGGLRAALAGADRAARAGADPAPGALAAGRAHRLERELGVALGCAGLDGRGQRLPAARRRPAPAAPARPPRAAARARPSAWRSPGPSLSPARAPRRTPAGARRGSSGPDSSMCTRPSLRYSPQRLSRSVTNTWSAPASASSGMESRRNAACAASPPRAAVGRVPLERGVRRVAVLGHPDRAVEAVPAQQLAPAAQPRRQVGQLVAQPQAQVQRRDVELVRGVGARAWRARARSTRARAGARRRPSPPAPRARAP